MRQISFLVLASVLLWTGSTVSAAELRHFNPAVFGQSANKNIKLLLDDSGEIYPSSVQLDVKDGKFFGATVKYATNMTLEEARRSLNKLYVRWQKAEFANDPTIGLWRNEEKGFSVQLTRDKDEIVVIYVSFSGRNARKNDTPILRP